MDINSNQELSKYAKKDLRAFLFQAEVLQHTRIYHFLVAETIFIAAAVSVSERIKLFGLLSVAALATTVVLTLINLKVNWRIQWLIQHLKHVDSFYKDYITFKDFDKIERNSCEKKIMEHFLSESQESPTCAMKMVFQPFSINTGILYTWGLSIIFGAIWIVFIVYSLFKIGFCHCDA